MSSVVQRTKGSRTHKMAVVATAIMTASLLVTSLSGCAGASTTGGASFVFLSTQFTQLQEQQNFEKILASAVPGTQISFQPVDQGPFNTQLTTQENANQVKISLLGGLHADFVSVPQYLQDLPDSLVSAAKAAGIPDSFMNLGMLGGTTQKYIPWMQASYVLAINKKALQYLPAGVDVNHLTYDQFLAWMTAGMKATGKPIFGMPAGSKGLYYRFIQGYLLPSFTGGQITTYDSPDAVAAWTYMKQLWAVTDPASTTYDNMQDPLSQGNVLVAWDHVARLVDALNQSPSDYQVVPAPSGPKGLGYLVIVGGLAIPKGADVAAATTVINALLTPDVQNQVMEQNAFFPVVNAPTPSDVPASVSMEAAAVQAQASAQGAIASLPPIGMGDQDAALQQVFQDTFTQIVLQNKDIKTVLDAQSATINQLLMQVNVPCWAPDPVGPAPCQVTLS